MTTAIGVGASLILASMWLRGRGVRFPLVVALVVVVGSSLLYVSSAGAVVGPNVEFESVSPLPSGWTVETRPGSSGGAAAANNVGADPFSITTPNASTVRVYGFRTTYSGTAIKWRIGTGAWTDVVIGNAPAIIESDLLLTVTVPAGGVLQVARSVNLVRLDYYTVEESPTTTTAPLTTTTTAPATTTTTTSPGSTTTTTAPPAGGSGMSTQQGDDLVEVASVGAAIALFSIGVLLTSSFGAR